MTITEEEAKTGTKPAKALELVPDWAGEFDCFQRWVNHASSWLVRDPRAAGSVGERMSAICVDALGRRCHNGKDFMRARDENAFPVRYFWSCKPRDPEGERPDA